MPEVGVLVVAPNWLGDAVMALPALADIRRAHAVGRLIVAARPSGRAALCDGAWRGCDGRDQLARVVDGPADVVGGCAAREGRTDRSRHPVSELVRVGVGSASGRSEGTVGIRVRPADAVADEGDRAARRAASSGRPTTSTSCASSGCLRVRSNRSSSIPIDAVDAARALLVARGWDGSRPLLVVAPGAAYGTAKRWLPSHFGSLVTRAVQDAGAHAVLVGTAADADAARQVLDSIRSAPSRRRHRSHRRHDPADPGRRHESGSRLCVE